MARRGPKRTLSDDAVRWARRAYWVEKVSQPKIAAALGVSVFTAHHAIWGTGSYVGIADPVEVQGRRPRGPAARARRRKARRSGGRPSKKGTR